MISDLPELSLSNNLNLGTINVFGSCDPARILVVDDHPYSRLLVVDILKQAKANYEMIETDSQGDLFEYSLETQPDLIILDVALSHANGFEVCERLKSDHQTRLIPIILTSVREDHQVRSQSQAVQAEAFLSKPLERTVLIPEVALLIQRKRLYEWLDQIQQVLFLIAQAVRERYSEEENTGVKIDRLAQSFGEYLQLSPIEISDLILAAHLHDIGTVAIPDSILLKKGELTLEERELIKQHVLIGEKICRPMQHRQGIAQIIRHHHERWNGSGYPDGLSGDQIPLLAQIFQILDIYDALTSKRPYKQALEPKPALEILKQEGEKGWRNPELVQKFTQFIDHS